MSIDLEKILQCPKCQNGTIGIHSAPSCKSCGWSGRIVGGITDFVENDALSDVKRNARG